MLEKNFILLFIPAFIAAQRVTYDNYTLYKIHPQNEEQVKYLSDLYESSNDYHFWKPPSRVDDFVSVVSPPELKHDLEHSLKKRNIYTERVLENIQEAFDAQLYSRRRRSIDSQLYWTGYQTLEDINAWIEHLAATNQHVSVVVIGQTHEGYNITGVKISRKSGNKAFVLEGGSIGADWLSPVILTYTIEQLVNSNDPEVRQALEDYDWYIFPVTNPEGFEYTQEKERLWYKNRKPVIVRGFVAAIGVDVTKNYNSQWAVSGGSHTPSANNFFGQGPFSEPETRFLSAYIESIHMNQGIAGFLSFRSFGQRLVLPFAHTPEPLYNYNDMLTVGRRAMGSMAVRYNTQYLVGTSSAVSDGATGGITDWVKYRFNPPVAATFLLRDNGGFGYVLPVAQVQPSCEETFDSLLAILREAKWLKMV